MTDDFPWYRQSDLHDLKTTACFAARERKPVLRKLIVTGMRLYPETTEKKALGLVASKALANGVLLQTYSPAAA